MTDYREFQDGEVVPGTSYRVARLIGAGGMGRVYEVEHVELGKRFVLKALLRELSRREDLAARLRNEWRALARLEHPNIVNVTDAGISENGFPYYVMERLEGETLSALLHRQRRLHPQQALTIAAAALRGLHAAHQIGVVHRDVKPPNIYLTTSGGVKVLDFGIAKIKDANGVITARGIAVGTPRYMSPEQAQGATVDARSDIYAVGLMLFEMVSGVGPFDDAKDHNELLLAHLGRTAPLLSSISVVAPELDAMVAALLAKDPRERPSNAEQVAATLESMSQRYAHFVATEAPTLNVTPHPSPNTDPTTRLDGARRAVPLAPPTRPDAPLALSQQADDKTTAVSALEVATTAAHVLPTYGKGGTLRIVDAAPATPQHYGSDTLVDSPTRAPTGIPAGEAERTELLLTQPLLPGARTATEPGPTHTAVPLVEANLTPPPVVPNIGSVSPPAPRGRPAWPLFVVAGVAVGLIGGGTWLWRTQPSPTAAAAAPVPVAEPVAPAAVPAAEPAARIAEPAARTPEPVAEPAPPASGHTPAVAAPLTTTAPVGKSLVSARIESKKSVFLNAPPPAPQKPKSASGAGSMPGSGL